MNKVPDEGASRTITELRDRPVNGGVSEATLSRFMSGERGLTLTVLDRLADYLGLTLCDRASR